MCRLRESSGERGQNPTLAKGTKPIGTRPAAAGSRDLVLFLRSDKTLAAPPSLRCPQLTGDGSCWYEKISGCVQTRRRQRFALHPTEKRLGFGGDDLGICSWTANEV